ncbi:hypothetical protein [Aureitalea marina]|uniref:Uncharacterized protein n=1 Tax=Aureitalea marina TaxID=930804 RepID=A0A2S7KP88_9FLAO|nr:hypothetical protein [Aureitalea marina]PQB04420.1 hypothetical protein BST85_05540 [Aureitalea marina]
MKKIIEYDRRLFRRLRKFHLPHSWKKVGLTIAIAAFVLMLVKRFVDEPEWVKPLLANIMLIGLLIISISKEKVEDEMMASIRAQSYGIAFVSGVIYAIVQPYVNFGVAWLLGSENPNTDMSYFQVLVFMLIVQLLFFKQFKRACL